MLGKIYLIRNKINGKGYVGQTVKSVYFRFRQHKYSADHGSDAALHRAMRKHGFENFEIKTVVSSCEPLLLDDLERHYIKFYGTYAPTGHGYNLTEGGDGGADKVWTKEGKEKLSLIHKGNSYAKGHKVPEESKAKISEAHKGKKKVNTEETKKKISSTLRGHPVSEETRRKISEVQKGKKRGPLSEEAKRKIGDKNRGRKFGPLSEEQKLQRSAAMKGKKKSPESIAKRTATRAAKGFTLSEEARAKISDTLSGRTHTEDEKKAISEGLKKWWEVRKTA